MFLFSAWMACTVSGCAFFVGLGDVLFEKVVVCGWFSLVEVRGFVGGDE